MKTITVDVPDGKDAVWKDGYLTLVDAEETRPVTERVKNWDDVVRELGYDPVERLLNHTERGDGFDIEPDEIAYIKIKAIVTVLNEGWKPKFTPGECRYFPCFGLFTREEIDEMGEEKRSRMVLRSWSRRDDYSGIAPQGEFQESMYVHMSCSPMLAFKTGALAEYAGEQFVREYADFIFPEWF